MLNVFDAILNFLSMVGSFVSNLVTGIFSMFEIIADSFSVVLPTIGFMPPMLTAYAIAGVGICIVFHIIGR